MGNLLCSIPEIEFQILQTQIEFSGFKSIISGLK